MKRFLTSFPAGSPKEFNFLNKDKSMVCAATTVIGMTRRRRFEMPRRPCAKARRRPAPNFAPVVSSEVIRKKTGSLTKSFFALREALHAGRGSPS
jgi:hypothetical protein